MIRVGCCGWAVAQARYLGALDAVEVQQTFYEPRTEATLRRWRAQAPEAFAFTVKCFQVVTHERTSPTYRRLRRRLPEGVRVGHFEDNATVRAAWAETLRCARVLRAPIVLVQTPPRFEPTPEHLRRLKSFATWEEHPDVRIAFEPRGPRWQPALVDELCASLGWLRAGDPFSLPPPSPAHQATAYFRLHGIEGYGYAYRDDDLERLLEWARRYGDAWVFFNNRTMWADALRMRARVEEQPPRLA